VDRLIQHFLLPVLLVGVRIAGLMTFAPFLGSVAISPRFKAQLTVALTALLFPVCAPQSIMLSVTNWLGVALSEAFLGLLMGLAVQFVFEGAILAGQIAGVQMGYSLENIIDPQTQVNTTVMSEFHQTVVLLIFLYFNVHVWMIRALAESYTLVPVGSFQATGPLVKEFLHIANAVWIVGVEVAAPVLLATMLTDFALSFLSKASPQLPILLFGLSFKMLLGMAVLVGAMAFWPGFFQLRFAESISVFERLLHVPH
jgi:flagellar biosynthesis protein FliR